MVRSIKSTNRPSWSTLGAGARLFRVAHAAWGIFNLAGLAYIWLSAAMRRRDRLTYSSMTLLAVEGVALVVGGGDCPFGAFQARLGDPVPMFEWVLPQWAAKAAIPVLAAVSVVGIVAVIARGNRHSCIGAQAHGLLSPSANRQSRGF